MESAETAPGDCRLSEEAIERIEMSRNEGWFREPSEDYHWNIFRDANVRAFIGKAA
jgi:hypothetical protein